MKSEAELARWAATPWPELGLTTLEALEAALREFAAALPAATDREAWLSRKRGLLALLNESWLRLAPREHKPALGAGLNALKQQVEAHFAAAAPRPATAPIPPDDITLPGPPALAAAMHPMLAVRDEIAAIFLRMGYTVADGPEIETEYYNFEALNIPAGHPARDEHDTLYVGPGLPHHLLRTHTSPVQVRIMQRQPPPVRVIVPGRVYRRDTPDASHSPNFHQIEGLAVDRGLHFGHLKGTLDHFARAFFGSSVTTRLRPSYFPFTEPSAELDVSCIFCAGAGCRTCKQSGWIELLGCGMVDPAVFSFAGYDPTEVSGFAFGLGIERMTMIRYGWSDIQRLYAGDIRELEQFR